VVWGCGTETLELMPNATYVQATDYAGGGHATYTGIWKVIPMESRLVGAQVVVQDAMEYCSSSVTG
jgi:hypothetical protein